MPRHYIHLNRYNEQARRLAFWRNTAFLFIAMSVTLVISMMSMSHRVTPADLVYQVCNESRTSLTIDERGCADLQDQTNTEFICAERGTDPDTRCWVEEK